MKRLARDLAPEEDLASKIEPLQQNDMAPAFDLIDGVAADLSRPTRPVAPIGRI